MITFVYLFLSVVLYQTYLYQSMTCEIVLISNAHSVPIISNTLKSVFIREQYFI